MMRYDVQLHTPLGKRSGKLEVKINGSYASGVLHILNRSEPFEGEIDPSGQCRFAGKLVTLTRTIPYQAEGRITEDVVELYLTGNTGCYRLTGVSV